MTEPNGSGTAWKILGVVGGVLVLLAGFVLHSLDAQLKDALTMDPATRSELDAHDRRIDKLEARIERLEPRGERP